MKFNIAAVLMFTLIFLSCENPTEPLQLRSPNGETPIVTGLRITTERDPTPVDVWGIPNDGDVTNNQSWQYSSQSSSKKIEVRDYYLVLSQTQELLGNDAESKNALEKAKSLDPIYFME